ncbi:YIP1 family protein [Evansella sp. AB-P1]|uniref:YIP1 family protein n=1 Tax=Evansella sp. AB-P1 TaxID=3037653 RepID=UPI00241E067A|nr:YIP1 family protein [Evansella sp. AB-P1]MDG5790188.1 YIP1 family protein [Evansella sp. AB-P1]
MQLSVSKSSFSQIMFDPTVLFEHVKQKPKPLFPILLVILTALLLNTGTFPYIQQEINQFLELETSNSNSIVMFSIMTFILCGGFLIELIIHSLIIYFIIALVSVDVQHLRTIFSIIGYSWFPILIKSISFIIIIIMTGNIFEPQGLRVLFPGIENGIVAILLKNIDIFILWQYFLIYLGVKVLLKNQHWMLSASITLCAFLISICFKILPEIVMMLI